MLVRENEYNYLTDMNNVKVIQCSSNEKSCNPKNIIDNASKTIWLSLKGFPQSVTFDLTHLIKKPKPFFQYWGIHCWHAYSTNPKEVEIQCSADNKSFESLGHYQLHFKPGVQVFEIEQKEPLMKQGMSNYFKIIVHKSCGGDRTYINQLFLFDTFDSMNSGRLHVTPAKTNTNDTQSNNLATSKRKEEIIMTSENENTSENNDEKDVNQIYDSSKENDQFNQKETYQTPTRKNDNNNGKAEIELNTLIKETESDIDVEPSNHDKIINALQHMKRIEKIFKSKGIPTKQIEFNLQKNKSNDQSHLNRLKYYNSRANKKDNQYSNYESNLSANNYQKLERELNDLNNHIKTLNFDSNYESLYSSNRTRATSLINKTFNDYNTHYLFQHDISERNLDHINNKGLFIEKKEKENEPNKTLETRMDKVENKVVNIEKEMGQLKAAFFDLNQNIIKRTERVRNDNEEDEVEELDEHVQKDSSEENLNENYEGENTENTNDERLLSKRNIEMEISALIDQKFDSLANKIEYQIYNKYLTPSVKAFENKVQQTMDQMKKTIKKITSRNNKANSSSSSICNHSNDSSITSNSKKYKTYRNDNSKRKHSRNKKSYEKLDKKYDKITELGEKLYAKLLEKQLKLEESSQFFKQMSTN